MKLIYNYICFFSLIVAGIFFVSCGCSDCSVVAESSTDTKHKAEILSVDGTTLGMGGPDRRLYSIQDVDESDLTNEPSVEDTSIESELYYTVYQVRKGDMIGLIAEHFGVSQDAIISLNTIRNTRSLQIGDYLKIPTMDGIAYTVAEGDTIEKIARKYKIEAQSILAVNSVQPELLQPGSYLFLPGAKLDWVTLQEINGDLFKKPLHSRYYVSSPYGWRKSPFTGARSFHGGIDMAANTGVRVYAAMGGTVSKVVYNDRVYGNYVIVTHHSGYKTLYAHLSSINTKKGKWVDTSTCIGRVGSTGMSTGSHLHFTVYKYSTSKNPAILWN